MKITFNNDLMEYDATYYTHNLTREEGGNVFNEAYDVTLDPQTDLTALVNTYKDTTITSIKITKDNKTIKTLSNVLLKIENANEMITEDNHTMVLHLSI